MIALLSDIHANLVALEAVLKDMQELDVSTALCLGDTVGYGPDPAACVKLVREHCLAGMVAVISRDRADFGITEKEPEPSPTTGFVAILVPRPAPNLRCSKAE